MEKSQDLKKIEQLFIKHKTNRLRIKGVCYDCNKEIVIKANVTNDGKLTIEGGAIYFTDYGNFMKCDNCYSKSSVLHRKIAVYSRVVGYLRPVSDWNIGKKEEWKNRKNIKLDI